MACSTTTDNSSVSKPHRLPGQYRVFGILVSLLIGLLAVSGVAEAETQRTDCRRHLIEEGALSYISSATWVPSKKGVVITNAFETGVRSRLLTRDGQVRDLEDTIANQLLVLESAGEDFLSMNGSFQERFEIHWLDGDLQPKHTITLLSHDSSSPSAGFPSPNSVQLTSYDNRRTPATYQIRAYYDQELVGETLVGFAHAYGPLGPMNGFFATSIAKPEGANTRLLFEYEPDYYLLANPMIAGVGSVAYILAQRVGDQPTLYAYDTRRSTPPTRIGELPGTELAPSIDMLSRGLYQLPDIYHEMESFEDMPVALFTNRQNDLLLLRRTPAPDSGTLWTLTPIKTGFDNTGQLSINPDQELTLPTRAPSVSLVPSANRWLIVERGDVRMEGVRPVQEISALVDLPARWIEELVRSPLVGGQVLPDLCVSFN